MTVFRFALPFVLAAGLACVCASCVAQDSPDASPPLSPDQTTLLAELMERDWENRPPWAEMAVMILKGESMGTGKGWFSAAQRRHTWQWLAERFPDATSDSRITAEEIPPLSADDFDRVDRDHDGAITEADFQFDKNPVMEDDSPAGSIFSRLDEDSNGRLTHKELKHWFDQSTGESDFLSVEDLKDALGYGLQPKRRRTANENRGEHENRREDPRWKMLGMLLDGEMGSFTEGPNLNEQAPEIDLPLVAHSDDSGDLELTDRLVRLEKYRGSKPVVLIFGSFT